MGGSHEQEPVGRQVAQQQKFAPTHCLASCCSVHRGGAAQGRTVAAHCYKAIQPSAQAKARCLGGLPNSERVTFRQGCRVCAGGGGGYGGMPAYGGAAAALAYASMPRMTGGGASQPWRSGDWDCQQCRGHNFASRSRCFQCGSEKPPQSSATYFLLRAGFSMQPGVGCVSHCALCPLCAVIVGTWMLY